MVVRVIRICGAAWRDGRGVTALEYGVLAVAILTAVILVTNAITSAYPVLGNAIIVAVGG